MNGENKTSEIASLNNLEKLQENFIPTTETIFLKILWETFGFFLYKNLLYELYCIIIYK